jgi:hypothetical protein
VTNDGPDLVRWFLNFLNLDLENLPQGDLAKVAIELDGALKGEVYRKEKYGGRHFIVGNFWDKLAAKDGEEMKKIQQSLNSFLGSIKENYDRVKNSLGLRFYDYDEVKSLCTLVKIEFTLTVKGRFDIGLAGWGGEEEDSVSTYGFAEEYFDDATCRLIISSDNLQNTTKFQFLKAFDGLPWKALRKCPICENWFLHLSKRKKEVCSNKCAALKLSRKKWEEIKADQDRYQKELEKKREYSHQRYVALHPQGKVRRNPRKPKATKEE